MKTLFEKTVIETQRKLRSNQRKKLHCRLFNTEPSTEWPQLNLFVPYHNSDLHSRLEKIISDDIVPNQKIVNGKHLYHYTSLSNLSSIIKSQAILGNAYLKEKEIAFNPNVFSKADVATGDSRVICFCPGQVDVKAFISDYNIKHNICRLSIDINKIHHSYTKDIYNQFFKLSDLQFSWSSILKINTFNACIKNCFAGNGMKFFLWFDNDQKNYMQVSLTKNEMVYYGNIFKINRFCSVQLFNIINKVDNAEFKTKFYTHLSELNDEELKKFLIVFAQNLTLFAEANFNTFLSLEEIKINVVLVLGDHKIKLDLSELDAKNYSKALEVIAVSDLSKLKELYGKSVNEDNTICFKKTYDSDESIHAFGTEIPSDGDWGKQDYTNLPARIFATNEYVEIRVGVNQLPQFENQDSSLVLK